MFQSNPNNSRIDSRSSLDHMDSLKMSPSSLFVFSYHFSPLTLHPQLQFSLRTGTTFSFESPWWSFRRNVHFNLFPGSLFCQTSRSRSDCVLFLGQFVTEDANYLIIWRLVFIYEYLRVFREHRLSTPRTRSD